MTDETKLINDVLYSLKVPPKQTRQNKKSMRRSEKNIKRNLYDDVLKPLTPGLKEGGALKAGMLGALAGSKALGKSKIKVEKPKEKKGKGSADPLTGKLVRTYSVKEKEQMKKKAKDSVKASGLGTGLGETFKVYPSAYKNTKGKSANKATGGKIELPKAADLDGDGTFNRYETARGEAIQKAMAKEKVETASLGKAISSKIPEMMSRFQADQQTKKAKEEKMFQEMVKKEKAKYGNTQQMKEGGIVKGGGIAIKGLNFKGVF